MEGEPGNHRIGGWIGPGASLDVLGEKKKLLSLIEMEQKAGQLSA